MSVETLRDAFLWCAVINYGVLLVWFLFFILAHDLIYRLHGRWFRLSWSSLISSIMPGWGSSSSALSC